MNISRPRRDDLDLAKGLGIFLVVFGHIAARQQSAGNSWYTCAQTAVYTFHMPFFLYLSGYVAFMTGAARTNFPKWPRLAARRSERLLLPFITFGVILVVGKLIASHFMYVDNNPANLKTAFINLVWNTDASPAISIWYMFVVFLATLLTPILFWLSRGNAYLILAFSLALFLIGLPHYVFADRFAEYYFFFVLGGVAADLGEGWSKFVDKNYLMASCLLLAIILYLFSLDAFSPHWSHLLCGIVAIPALHGLVRSGMLRNSKAHAYLGAFSFIIYLLNTPAMGVIKGVLLKWLEWDGRGFIVIATAMLLGGLLIPIAIKKLIFSRMSYIDRLTD